MVVRESTRGHTSVPRFIKPSDVSGVHLSVGGIQMFGLHGSSFYLVVPFLPCSEFVCLFSGGILPPLFLDVFERHGCWKTGSVYYPYYGSVPSDLDDDDDDDNG